MNNRLSSYSSSKAHAPELARVMSYDDQTGDLVCYTESGRQIHNPMYLSPFYSQSSFNGFFFIPSIADTLMVDYTANNVPFIAGCTTPYGDFTQLGSSIQTVTLNPGDYGFLVSPSGGQASGGLIIKKTGSVLLQSNPFTSMLLVPSLNAMISNFQTMYLSTLLGDINVYEDEYGGVFEVALQDVNDATTSGNIYDFSISNSAGENLYSSTLSRLGAVNVQVGNNVATLSIDTSGNLNIKTESSVTVDSPSVVLGAKSSSDPAVLGNENKNTLTDIVQALQDLLQAITDVAGKITTPGGGPAAVLAATADAITINLDIAKIKSDIQQILSQKVTLV